MTRIQKALYFWDFPHMTFYEHGIVQGIRLCCESGSKSEVILTMLIELHLCKITLEGTKHESF